MEKCFIFLLVTLIPVTGEMRHLYLQLVPWFVGAGHICTKIHNSYRLNSAEFIEDTPILTCFIFYHHSQITARKNDQTLANGHK